MAEQSKFAGALGRLKQPAATEPEPETAVVDQPAVKPVRIMETLPAIPAGRGGKRSDPAYSPTTFFVRKETKRRASRLLEDQDAGKDLSDLVEELLSQWVFKHSNM